jgi:RNA polymerase sigma-70 factor (ECF subfamily)
VVAVSHRDETRDAEPSALEDAQVGVLVTTAELMIGPADHDATSGRADDRDALFGDPGAVETGRTDDADAVDEARLSRGDLDAHERAMLQERRLVRRLKQGEPRAFQEMVHTYQHRVYGLVYRMLGNRHEAEDIAQDVFIAVFRHVANFRGDSRFYTWIFRIATNHCKNRLKYLKGRHAAARLEYEDTPEAAMHPVDGGPAQTLQSHVPGPEQTVEATRLETVIQRELAALDDEFRVLIVLRDIQGMSYEDIRKITGLAEGTVKSRLHRARAALKQRIEPHLR